MIDSMGATTVTNHRCEEVEQGLRIFGETLQSVSLDSATAIFVVAFQLTVSLGNIAQQYRA